MGHHTRSWISLILVIWFWTMLSPAPASAITINDARAIVTAFYQQILLRLPEPSGLQVWTDALVSGQLTVEQVRQAIASSPEAQASQLPKSADVLSPIVVIPGMTSQAIFNTGPFVCDGIPRTTLSLNISGRTLAIRKAVHWHGVDKDTSPDFFSIVRRRSDGAIVSPFFDDHYLNPVGTLGTFVLDFSVPLRIPPGDGFQLDYECTSPTHGHIIVVIWWEWEPP